MDPKVYPGSPDIPADQYKVCQMDGCGKQFKMVTYLVKHLKKEHGFANEGLQGQWIHTEAVWERRGNESLQLSAAELEHVGLARDDISEDIVESSFVCKKCEPERKFSKLSCLSHMTRVHGQYKPDVQEWATHKDGLVFGNHKENPNLIPARLQLTRAIRALAREGDGARAPSGGQPPQRNGSPEAGPRDALDQGGEVEQEAPPFDLFLAMEASIFQSIGEGVVEENALAAAAMEAIKDRLAPDEEAHASAYEGVLQLAAFATRMAGLRAQASSAHEGWDDGGVEPLLQAKPKRKPAPPAAAGVATSETIHMSVAEKAKAWIPESWKPGSDYPIDYADVALDNTFERWLRQQRVLKPQSIVPAVEAVSRFLSLIEVSDGCDRTGAGVLAAIYEADMLATLRDLPILKSEYSWSQKMSSALNHWCQFHIEGCERRKDPATRASIAALQNQLVGWAKEAKESHKTQCRARKRYDAERISKMADCDTLKASARCAMVEIKQLHQKYAGELSMPESAAGRAVVALAGIVYICNWAGRDGEWKKMPESHVRHQLDKGADYFVCPDHKTADELGEAVKHVSAGTKEAIRHYLELPTNRPEPRLLFRAVRAEKVSFSTLLRTYGKRFLRGTQPPGVNLVRKSFTKAVLQLCSGHPALSALGTVDKHSPAVILQHYLALTFQEQAALGEAVYKAAMGEPPAWPTDEEVEDGPAAGQPKDNNENDEEDEEGEVDNEESSEASDEDVATQLAVLMDAEAAGVLMDAGALGVLMDEEDEDGEDGPDGKEGGEDEVGARDDGEHEKDDGGEGGECEQDADEAWMDTRVTASKKKALNKLGRKAEEKRKKGLAVKKDKTETGKKGNKKEGKDEPLKDTDKCRAAEVTKRNISSFFAEVIPDAEQEQAPGAAACGSGGEPEAAVSGEAVPPAKRRKTPVLLSAAQQTWLAKNYLDDGNAWEWPVITSTCQRLLDLGIAQDVLSVDSSVQGVRSFLNRERLGALAAMEAERKKLERKEKRAAKKAAATAADASTGKKTTESSEGEDID